jgi:hypothetical protein
VPATYRRRRWCQLLAPLPGEDGLAGDAGLAGEAGLAGVSGLGGDAGLWTLTGLGGDTGLGGETALAGEAGLAGDAGLAIDRTDAGLAGEATLRTLTGDATDGALAGDSGESKSATNGVGSIRSIRLTTTGAERRGTLVVMSWRNTPSGVGVSVSGAAITKPPIATPVMVPTVAASFQLILLGLGIMLFSLLVSGDGLIVSARCVRVA